VGLAQVRLNRQMRERITTWVVTVGREATFGMSHFDRHDPTRL